MDVKIEQTWKEALRDEFGKPYFADLVRVLHAEKAAGKVIYPPGRQIFRAFELTPLDRVKVVGCINDYCENKGFKTIIVANEMVFLSSAKTDQLLHKVLKEKTISRTVLYIPDYQEIIHHLLTQEDGPSREYADFLRGNEQLICDVFGVERCHRGGI